MYTTKDENFLANWISGSISDEIQKTLVSEEEYQSLIVLRESLAKMKSPTPDLELNYKQLQERKSNFHISATKPLYSLKIITIAASLLLLLFAGSYHTGLVGEKVYFSKKTIEKIAIGSAVQITLNKNTILSQRAPLYNANFVQLEKGEAYFEVVKGNPFSIKTDYGTIKVLGTKFTVKINLGVLEVFCFDGKVKINCGDKAFFVEKGSLFTTKIQKVIPISHYSIEPEWLTSFKKFEKSDLINVLTFLEMNYSIHIDYENTIAKNKFTGTLPTANLEDALKVVCYSFNLTFELHGKNVIIKE